MKIRNHRCFQTLLFWSIFVCGFSPSVWSFSFSRDVVRFERAKEHFRKGIIHFNKKQYLAAVEFFRNAIAEYPDYFTAREYLARSYKFSGFIDEALREWESLLEYEPNNVAIKNKIDTIRYRKIGAFGEYSPTDLVMTSEIISKQLIGYRFPNPVDFTVDDEKNIYISSFSLGKICKINPNGKGIDSYAPTLQSKLFGIDYHKNKIAVTDFAKDRVYIFSTAFKKILTFGESGNKDGQFHGPEGICFDAASNLYVVDSGNARVQKFNPNGAFILAFGKEGDFEGELNSPTDVKAVGDVVYISDTGNKRIAVFDDSGNFIKNINVPEITKPRGLGYQEPYLLISDEKKGLCFYNTSNGNYQWFYEWNNGARSFGALYAALYDRDGTLLALDYAHERISSFVLSKIHYSNLDVEITTVDTRQYPIVAIYCSVRGRDGNPLVGLTKENFQIKEDGVRVSRLSIDYLKRVQPSASIVLCIDRSLTAEQHHEEYKWAAEFLLQKIRVNDRVKIINFNKDLWEGNDFDWSRRRSLKAISLKEYKYSSDYGNVLYNAVYDVLSKLTRRAVLMFTDGNETAQSFKKYSPEYIIQFAKSHYVPIYVVTFKNSNPELIRIAKETGGAHIKSSDIDQLRTIYDKIKNAEEYRYLIMYRSYKLPAFRGWWSDIHISVDYKGQKGVEWGGYFAPSQQ